MIKKTAYAKLDLAIHINPQKEPDGFFPVNYIICQLELADKLLFEQKKNGIEIVCENPSVPKDKNNFIYQATDLLRRNTAKKFGTKISLTKNIPVKAGFGGGSTDAAATLHGLAELLKIKLSKKQIAEMSKILGKDFYYNYYGKLSEVQGNGKDYKTTPLVSELPKFWLLIVVPFEEKPSTGWVYEHLDEKTLGTNLKKFARLKKATKDNNKKAILENVFNDFEKSVIKHFPVVQKLKGDLKKAGALQTLMAGAGLSVVGFFNTQKKAANARKKLEGNYKQVIITRPLS